MMEAGSVQPVRCACLMMQKDEATLLLPWVLYHGALFGFGSLFVFDNGSTERGVIAALDSVAALGVNVDRSFSQKLDFVRKGEVLGGRMRALQEEGGWDVFLPLDCDEFLAVRDGDSVSFEPERILAGLSRVRDDKRIPYVITAYTNVLGTVDRFRAESCLKTFVQARGFVELDHGFHQVRSSLSETPMDSGFVYIHCHAKPFERVVRDAREKLAYWCDVDSPTAADALEAADGAGWHLVKYLRMTEREYLAGFSHEGTVALPGFAARLAAVGADTGFLLDAVGGAAEGAAEAAIPPHPAWSVHDGAVLRRSGQGVMVFGNQGPALNQLMQVLAAAGIDVGDEAELYLNQHWIAAFKSGDAASIRRELLVLAAQPRAWASWFPQAGLLTAEMAEVLRWPRAIQIVTAEDGGEQDRALLCGLDLPVFQVRWEDAAGEPMLLARAILAYLRIDAAPERIAAITACLPGAGVEGWVDQVTDSDVCGWCWLRGSDARQTVELLVDGVQRASAKADAFRGDLASGGIGDGRYGFRLSAAPGLIVGDARVEVRVAGTAVRLPGV